MEYNDIIYAKEGDIATVTLNRPHRMNAFTVAMIESMIRALEDAAADHEIRVIVVTGAGRAFSAGLDLKEPPNLRAMSLDVATSQMFRLPSLAIGIDKPIIACINGAAVGWGFEVALMCDVRIAVDNAKIGDPHLNYCLLPDFGGLFNLPRVVGWAKAFELIFTGQLIDGREAERVGLVNKAVPQDQLEATVKEIARTMASKSPLVVQMAKRGMRTGLTTDLKRSVDDVLVLQEKLVGTDDFAEAWAALKERRRPQFRGR